MRGQICAFVSRPIKECNREAALQTTCEIIDHLIGPGLPTHQPLVGIGIGAPGLINSKDGVVINAVNLDWVNLPLGKLLEERYHLPVCLLNDCQAAAMGEYIYAADLSEARNMVVVRVGHGIGAGIIINGQIFQGDGGSAGEIGHIVVTTDQTLSCRCGNVGCLETLASANALVQRAELAVMRIPPYPQPTALAKHAGSITLELIEQAFAEGDALAQEIVLEAGRYLGIALANLISTLNIHKIILIGDMACFGQPWLAAIQETMSQATLGRLAQETSVQIGDLKDNDVILGVSALMASNYSLLFQKQ